MTDFNIIRVIPFCGKSDEWPIWSQKFLAKEMRYKCKELFLGKLSITKADDEFDEVSVIEKKMTKTIELNEIAYTKLILSIDVKASNVKIAFNNYPEENKYMIGRISRKSMNLYLPLLWSS
jgi:hypothetical protein